MATNPMQRKSRNSFLLGMVITLVITGAIIALLIMQLIKYKTKEATEIANDVNVYVLKQNVISGQIITEDMLETRKVDKNLVPNNAVANQSIFSNFALTDKAGNSVITEYRNNNATLYLSRNGNRYELQQEGATGSYYIELNGNKEYVELAEVPVIAKINMNKNTVLTVDTIAKSDEKTTNDQRKVEYNMLVLPTQLESEEYIDIRLSLPTGQDYIVVSKKQVEIPFIDGVESDDTIWLKLSEDEIITMNNAIVDAFRIMGSKLQVVIYTEAGMQDAATPTYVPSLEVAELVHNNPNIVEEAREALWNRYNRFSNIRNNSLNPALGNSGTEGEENLKTKIEESITNSKENRKRYLQSLGGIE